MADVILGNKRCPACGTAVTSNFCPHDGTMMPHEGKLARPYAGWVCEQDGGHVVSPRIWPMRKHPNQVGPATMFIQCDKCSVWINLIEGVEIEHVTINTPQKAKAQERKPIAI